MIGSGVLEIRIRDAARAFRVMYVAKFDDAIYVLHCFQKKTQKTSRADLNLAAQRYRDLLKELGQARNASPMYGTRLRILLRREHETPVRADDGIDGSYRSNRAQPIGGCPIAWRYAAAYLRSHARQDRTVLASIRWSI